MAYTKSFYEQRHKNTLYSANTVLKYVQTFYNFQSSVDFGCGVGTWLSVSKEIGALKVKGYDGPWVPEEFLQIKEDEFQVIIALQYVIYILYRQQNLEFC